MDADEKIHNQDAFMSDQVGVIVATSAFGMGVDKSDVGLVVHYDISDSLENYVQEIHASMPNAMYSIATRTWTSTLSYSTKPN